MGEFGWVRGERDWETIAAKNKVRADNAEHERDRLRTLLAAAQEAIQSAEARADLTERRLNGLLATLPPLAHKIEQSGGV